MQDPPRYRRPLLERLRDIPGDAWDGLREGTARFRGWAARSLERVRDAPGDAWDGLLTGVGTAGRWVLSRAPRTLPRAPRARSSTARPRSGSGRTPWIAIVIGAAAVSFLAALGLLGTWGALDVSLREGTSPRGERPSPAPGRPEADVASSGSALQPYVNREGAYQLSHPPSWSITERGRQAAVAHPSGSAVVTVGTVEEGTADEAAARFLGRIASAYEEVELDQETVRPEAPVTGTAIDAEGNRSRFVAAVVEAGDQAFAISAFMPVDAPPLEADAMAIFRSFRPLEEPPSEP